MIKIVGKKIISGDLNLTRISFPIKAMVPRTALVNSTISCCMNPYYMKRAVEAKDPLERLKFVMTNTISAFYYISMFVKPVKTSPLSSTPSLERPYRPPFPMGHKFTASRSLTTHPSATSLPLALREGTAITVVTTSRLTLASTPWSSSTRAIKSTSSPMATGSTVLSTKKFTPGFLWEACVQRQLSLSSSTIRRMSFEHKSFSVKLKRGKFPLIKTIGFLWRGNYS